MKTLPLAGLAGAVLFSVSQFAAAQDDPITVIVTASRSAETVDETLVPVTVITREQIERSGATTLPEVLSTVPGVVIVRNGGAGQQASVLLRGTESRHVLVLIDGVRVGSATLGATPFQHIPLDQVDRVEVVRGPRSSLYGSDAIGGVIQIFTRRGKGAPQSSLTVRTGTHETGEVSAGISGGSDAAWYLMHATAFTTEGFDVCRSESTGVGGCYADQPDDDGYDNTSLSFRSGGRIGERFEVEAA
ncbi:MAG: TonB-dependent receptor plug domain-containing protein, partial [Boseongicola sp. SB0667_bin_21]|nr:TonB-dependent receptor plug domain-containing protein [Boseongicola sp. SB0667_bin_21]